MLKMLSGYFIIISILWTIPVFGAGQDAMQRFEKANQSYKDNDYLSAIDIYNELLKEGWRTAELEYNLGNAYFQTNEIGLAVLHFERAKQLKPGDKLIAANLDLARNKVESDIIEVPDFVLLRIWNSVSTILSPWGWMILQVLLCIASLISIYMWRFGHGRRDRIIGFVTGSLFLLLFLLALTAGHWRANNMDSANDGIVLQQSFLYSGPDERSDQLKSLPIGEKVEVVDKVGEWYKVELLNKEKGWVSSFSLEFI
ncbi:MAG: SH3 domain-containing protein [Saprospiraceae bacterium]|nr:SH3 domain-containing protein [Saprospiraceae bacterium]